ncbi:extracellular solute-binding protein [Paenibacillus mesophilus]|uniref:ABC transporter substrate-binding protein n=1 Tax=Paenibacillus mesophilus TaxID=2582849 RepID=UPI00110DBC8E|nr:extracellular solute-binding protein [Paenibacillus mesophilus]TMV45420.1 extracellular solute-binding protein [Paenibacillus mesophilus]
MIIANLQGRRRLEQVFGGRGKRLWFTAAVGGMVLTTAACGGNTAGPQQSTMEQKVKKDPFTMLVYAEGVTPDEFQNRFGQVLQAKFPHITFDYQTNRKGYGLSEMLAEGKIPDLIRVDIPTLKSNYLDLGLAYDLNELVTKYRYDIKRFQNSFIQEIKDAGQSGALYGVPVPPYFPVVLYYNKSIFDRFGVAYPKDGMTWDEVYEIAKKVNRAEGDKMYRGFSANAVAVTRDNPLSLPILDPEKDQLHDADKWKQLFDNFTRFFQLPGNTIESTQGVEKNVFFSKATVAMDINQHSIYLKYPDNVDWDIAAVPVAANGPKLMGQRGPAYWSITKQSKHKEEAFEAIMTMLSDEIQTQDSRNGIPTTLVNENIRRVLGQDHPIYKTKHMQAVNYYPPAPPSPKRKPGLADVSGGTQQNLMNEAFHNAALGKTDANTALRELDEKLRQEIKKEQSK